MSVMRCEYQEDLRAMVTTCLNRAHDDMNVQSTAILTAIQPAAAEDKGTQARIMLRPMYSQDEGGDVPGEVEEEEEVAPTKGGAKPADKGTAKGKKGAVAEPEPEPEPVLDLGPQLTTHQASRGMYFLYPSTKALAAAADIAPVKAKTRQDAGTDPDNAAAEGEAAAKSKAATADFPELDIEVAEKDPKTYPFKGRGRSGVMFEKSAADLKYEDAAEVIRDLEALKLDIGEERLADLKATLNAVTTVEA